MNLLSFILFAVPLILLFIIIGTFLFNIQLPDLKFHNSESDINNVSFKPRNLLEENFDNDKEQQEKYR